MPKKDALLVDVEPSVLEWAINSAGWNRGELVKRLKVGSTTFDGWIKKEQKPSVRQLEALAKIVKRPLAVFFLPNPPQEKPLPKDYRMMPGKEGRFEKKTLLAIRRARRLQKLSKELAENLNAAMEIRASQAKIGDDPKKLAQHYAKEFGFTEEVRNKFRNPNEFFNFLREAIEDRNALVFQSSMPIEDARGFCLADESPVVVVVNSKDAIEARIFTLAHELGHLLLRESEIGLQENSLFTKNLDAVEKWCNDFASALLLPEETAKNEFALNKQALTESPTLKKLSRKLKISKAMLLYNMHQLGFISQSQYSAVLDRYKPIEEGVKTAKKKGGFAQSSDKRCLTEKGQKFVSLVANNVEKGFITHSEALDYLSIKSKNLDKVMGRAKK